MQYCSLNEVSLHSNVQSWAINTSFYLLPLSEATLPVFTSAVYQISNSGYWSFHYNCIVAISIVFLLI